jgi:hypothetical protein
MMSRTCARCGANFSWSVVIDGRRIHLNRRKLCLRCRPYKARGSPRIRNQPPPRTLVCAKCGRPFLAKQLIGGKMRSLYRRKYCLVCSPFGSHNTSRSPIGADPDFAERRRRRRHESWLRYQKKRRLERKRLLVELRGGQCEACGYKVTLAALEFHHRDRATKEFGLGTFSGTWERLVAEAAKCDLLCVNCHRRRHGYSGSPAALAKKARAVELMGGTCSGCSIVVPDSLFEFHHVDAKTKAFGISRDGLRRAWEEIAVELGKCVMLCGNCHREVHAGVRVLDRSSRRDAAGAAA